MRLLRRHSLSTPACCTFLMHVAVKHRRQGRWLHLRRRMDAGRLAERLRAVADEVQHGQVE